VHRTDTQTWLASLVLIDSNLDPAPEIPQPGSSQIGAMARPVFLRGGGYGETLARLNPGCARTMRCRSSGALSQAQARLSRFEGLAILRTLDIPRTYLYLPPTTFWRGLTSMSAAGSGSSRCRVRAQHHPDNPTGFVEAVLAGMRPVLADPSAISAVRAS